MTPCVLTRNMVRLWRLVPVASRRKRAANTLQVDGAARTFIRSTRSGDLSGKKIRARITRGVSGELVRFVNGVVGTQPELWQTRVLRTEQLDANLVAADVSLDTKELGVQRAGTAVLLLTRADGTL